MLFAHTQNEDGSNSDQPLAEHVFNVAKYMQHNLSPIGLGQLGFLIGFLHDIGKADENWQRYLFGRSDYHPPHANYGRILYNDLVFPNVDADFRFILSNVILGHHSNLFDAVDIDSECINIFGEHFDSASLEFSLQDWAKSNLSSDKEKLELLIAEAKISTADFKVFQDMAYQEFLEWKQRSFEHFAKIDANNVSNRYAIYKSFLQMLLLSCLNDADTLDTQRHHDRISFSYDEIPNWSPYVHDIEEHIASFKQIREIDFIRKEISDACYADAFIKEDVPTIKRLSAPTGCGKTLCSTRYAFNYALTNNKHKVFYIIPFTTIIDQNAQVICDLLEDPKSVLVHHSNVIAENDMLALEQDGAYLSSTRYDEDVILTTQVRFLDGVFGASRSSNKLFCKYIDSIVIFDEFQSMPEKVIDMFYVLIDFMSYVMKCNVVLCSATQASSLHVNNETEQISGHDWEKEYRHKFRRTVYVDNVSYDKEECLEVEALIQDIINKKESVLVITNTKKQAEELFVDLAANYADSSVEVFYLSTNMHMMHRQKTLESIKYSLSCSDKITILVSTSLIEAGIDISFQSCIRYENGLDHVIQSGGRCNRNGEWDSGTVYIVQEPYHVKSRGYKDQKDSLLNALQYASDNNCLIEGALDIYYNSYLSRLGNKTKYDTQYGYLIDLLADNVQYKENEECKVAMGIPACLPPNTSCIRTVRNLFHTIEDREQLSVFIALDDTAQELLRQFKVAKTYKHLAILQKMMQRYSVNIYINQQALIQQLNQVTNDFLDATVLYVDNEYLYSPRIGLSASTSALGDISAIVL